MSVYVTQDVLEAFSRVNNNVLNSQNILETYAIHSLRSLHVSQIILETWAPIPKTGNTNNPLFI